MPNLLKIGQTSGSIKRRVEQLSSATGVPKPFVIEAYFASQEPKSDEKILHDALVGYRHPGREFFALSLKEALIQCEIALGRKAQYHRHNDGPFREP